MPGGAAVCTTPAPSSSWVPTGPSPHGPDQALTALEVLQGMTVNAAWAAGEEHQAGRIRVGHRADLTVFADDPLTTAATELPDLPVLLTAVDAKPTHRVPGI